MEETARGQSDLRIVRHIIEMSLVVGAQAAVRKIMETVLLMATPEEIDLRVQGTMPHVLMIA